MLTDAWRLAVGTLTAVRVAPPREVDARRAGAAMLLAPIAVLPLGLAVAVVLVAAGRLGLPSLVIALLALAAVVLGTRGLHLDGLSDVADGLAASYDRERSLAVMRSGTAGPAGVVALILVLGLQAASLAALAARGDLPAAVLSGVTVCASRVALAAACVRGLPAARPDGLGRTVAGTVAPLAVAGTAVVVAVVLAATALWAGLPWWRGPLAVAVAGVVVALLLLRTRRRFGGVTGDVLGAAVELALAALLVVLA